ncbi:MAG: Gfo/Idh/MocA family oxidoreductase [Pirellulales bacterium]|nr:Gfo/Idh/MocA family oxidoreductase [Pirellulales bacterium]
MVNVGIVGIGFMGLIHYLAYQRISGARVAAIASRDPKKLAGDWRGIKGNFGPAGSQMDLGNVRRYAELDTLLSDSTIDLVDICLPPALHAEAAIAALRAGKHVLCEKPMALNSKDAARMMAAAEKAGRLLMVAHVLPFFPEYAFALAAIQSGRYGRLLGGHFRRIISDPLWIKDFYDPDQVGGPVIDLHVHDAHFIRAIAGMPQAVFSSGRLRPGTEVVEFVNTQFLYPAGGPTITAASGVIHQQGRGFAHGYEIYLEKGTLLFDFAALADGAQATPLTVLGKGGKVTRPALGASDPLDGFVAELKEACRAVQRGQPSSTLSGELARDALVLCERQSRSVRTGKIVRM